jgi:DNA-binding transcriptional LysR family regulator
MPMNHNLLIYYSLSFTAVVKAQGFSAASKKMAVSKAQLSRHVAALEELLGLQLLHRTTRSLSLTEQGKQFFTACQGIEESCVEAVNQLKQDYSKMEGTLRVTAPIDFGIQFLPPIISEFSKAYPNMNVVLSLSNENEDIVGQAFDLSIRIANRLPDSSLKMRTLLNFRRLICATPKYFENRAKPRQLEELKNYTCITSVNRNSAILFPQWLFFKNTKIINQRLEKFIEVDSLFAQHELIKRSVGIGRLPDYFIEKELRSGELIELFKTIEKPDVYVFLLYPNTPVIPKKTRAFIDFVKERVFE